MKQMRLLAALLLLFVFPISAAERNTHAFTVGADVNDKGEITQIQPDADVAPPIAAILTEAMKRWQFVPAQHDGKPAPAHTFIKAELTATPAGRDRYSLRVKFVSQGPRDQPIDQLNYPAAAIRLKLEGNVTLIGELHADGSLLITDALEQVKWDDKKLLLKAARDHFLSERYSPETVAGQPVPARFRVTVNFNLNGPNAYTAFMGPSPGHGARGSRHRGYCGAGDDADPASPPSELEQARRQFLTQTGFNVGVGADRTWLDGMSSVLQPLKVGTVVMQP